MATATSVTVRQSNDQFRGIFNETWVVKATLNAGSLADGAGETDDITVPGVALGGGDRLVGFGEARLTDGEMIGRAGSSPLSRSRRAAARRQLHDAGVGLM